MFTIALVSCSSQKLDRPAPARELYTSSLFRKSITYAERTCNRTFIVSALHGLVEPHDVLAPYNFKLSQRGKSDRRAWGERVVRSFPAVCVAGPCRLVLLAGADYVEAIRWGAHWHLKHAEIVEPLARKQIGERLSWLTNEARI